MGLALFKDYRDALRQLADEELTIGTGKCKDQVGKYVLENTLCKHPKERFTAKDLLIMVRFLHVLGSEFRVLGSALPPSNSVGARSRWRLAL